MLRFYCNDLVEVRADAYGYFQLSLRAIARQSQRTCSRLVSEIASSLAMTRFKNYGYLWVYQKITYSI